LASVSKREKKHSAKDGDRRQEQDYDAGINHARSDGVLDRRYAAA
jgi:hypothetical protein